MWREGEGKRNRSPDIARILGSFGAFPLNSGPTSLRVGDAPMSEPRGDQVQSRGVVSRRGVKPADRSTLEQHAPLKRVRTHDRKASYDAFPNGPVIAGHQCDLPQDVRKRTRFGDGLLQEHPTVERLMLGPNEAETRNRVAILAGQIAEPHCQIRESRKTLVRLRIGDEACRIDEALAAIEARVEE